MSGGDRTVERDPDVTVVVNAHREGTMAVPSLRSVAAAKAVAEAAGRSVEVVVVADRPDAATVAVMRAWSAFALRLEIVDNGDLGLSRNDGVAVARGRHVAFLDADDLWGASWLAEAIGAAARDRRAVVWHPEVNLYFGLAPEVMRHVDMESPEYDPVGLIENNQWTALSFADRALYRAHPYPATDLAAGFGYEDWSWHLATVAAGVIHRIVPGTAHAVRQKPVSLVRSTTAAGAIPRPARLAVGATGR